jgi:hypothetical protein
VISQHTGALATFHRVACILSSIFNKRPVTLAGLQTSILCGPGDQPRFPLEVNWKFLTSLGCGHRVPGLEGCGTERGRVARYDFTSGVFARSGWSSFWGVAIWGVEASPIPQWRKHRNYAGSASNTNWRFFPPSSRFHTAPDSVESNGAYQEVVRCHPASELLQ